MPFLRSEKEEHVLLFLLLFFFLLFLLLECFCRKEERMENSVAGIAGAVRIKQLTIAGLTRAEQHGKRLDATGQDRAINDEPPVTTTGLHLGTLYKEHVEGAFIPKAKAKAMHLIIQFPKGLVDGDNAVAMLGHARAFAATVFGDQSVFGDRVDRDEKSQHVVDLFIAPRYEKVTKRASKPAISMTRHLKTLAREHGHPPVPAGIGRAVQDAWFNYLRDEMGLAKVQRGIAKQYPGSDWKSAEQLRCEELEILKERAEREIEFGFEAGRQVGLENAEDEYNRKLSALHEWERRLSGYDRERENLAAMLEEQQQQASLTQKKAEDVAEAVREAADARAYETQIAAEREADRIISDARREVDDLLNAAKLEKRAACVARDEAIARAEEFEVRETQAQKEAKRSQDELAARGALLETRENKLARKIEKQRAITIGLEAWLAGDIANAGRNERGGRVITWRNDETMNRIRPKILPAISEVWKLISKLSFELVQKAAAVEEAAKKDAQRLLNGVSVAVSSFLDRFETASDAEKGIAKQTSDFREVEKLIQNPAIQSVSDGDEESDMSDLLVRAYAAGIRKKGSAIGK